MAVDAQAGLMSARGFGRALLPVFSLAAMGLFTYHALIGYDPYAGFETVPDDTEAFFFAPSGSSPVLIALVTGWLLFNRRFRIRDAYGQHAWAVPAALSILTASGFYIWGTYVGAADLLVVSLIFMLLGCGALLAGPVGMRAVWLPAAFMLLLLPPPAEFINYVVFPLQLVTAKISVWVLGILGIPAFQLGDQILTTSRIFQVIEACSGLRSIETMTMSGVLYAELFYRSRLQALLIVIAGPLIGFLVNQLRVLSIVLNPYAELTDVHTAQGIVMLVGGVLLLAVLDWVLGRMLPPGPAAHAQARASTRTRGNPMPRLVLMLVLLGTLGMAGQSIRVWQNDEPLSTPLFQFPARFDGWRVTEGLPLDRQFMGSVGVSEWLHREYSRDGESIVVFVGADRRLRRRTSLMSEKTALPGSGWEILDRRRVSLGPQGPWVEELELRSRRERRLAYYWREGMRGVLEEALRSAFALDQSPLRRPGRALVFRVSTTLGASETDRTEAERRLREFVGKLRDFYE